MGDADPIHDDLPDTGDEMSGDDGVGGPASPGAVEVAGVDVPAAEAVAPGPAGPPVALGPAGPPVAPDVVAAAAAAHAAAGAAGFLPMGAHVAGAAAAPAPLAAAPAPKPKPTPKSVLPRKPRSERLAGDDGWPVLEVRAIAGAHGKDRIKISQNADGYKDLRAICGVCGSTRTRTGRPSASAGAFRDAQGRGLGTIFAFLVEYDCIGGHDTHKSWVASYEARDVARQRFHLEFADSALYDEIVAVERPLRPGVDGPNEEPLHKDFGRGG